MSDAGQWHPSDVFAGQVQAIRRRRGWSQDELADRLGLDQTTIGRIEAGKRRVTIDELTAFAVALDVSPMALMVPKGHLPADGARMNLRTWQPAPGTEVGEPWRAAQWFRGVLPLSTEPEVRDRFDAERPEFEQEARRRFPELTRILDLVTFAQRHAVVPFGDPATLDSLLDAIEAETSEAIAATRRTFGAKRATNPLDLDSLLDLEGTV